MFNTYLSVARGRQLQLLARLAELRACISLRCLVITCLLAQLAGYITHVTRDNLDITHVTRDNLDITHVTHNNYCLYLKALSVTLTPQVTLRPRPAAATPPRRQPTHPPAPATAPPPPDTVPPARA